MRNFNVWSYRVWLMHAHTMQVKVRNVEAMNRAHAGVVASGTEPDLGCWTVLDVKERH